MTPRRWLWGAAPLVGFVLDGVVGLAVGLLIAVYVLAGAAPRTLTLMGALVLVTVPVAVLVIGLPPEDLISPKLVERQLIASHLTFTGVAFVVVGVIGDVRARRPAQPGVSPDGPASATKAR